MRPISKSLTKPFEMPVQFEKKGGNRAVFLDRDGTINVERGYLLDPVSVDLLPTAAESIRTLNSLGFLTIIVTNQAPIHKGILTFEELETINQRLWDELQSRQAFYNALYFCPHATDAKKCFCRKPEPGLVFQAALDFEIDLRASFFIGDKLSDIEAGKKSKCRTILVLTGWGNKTLEQLKDASASQPDCICNNLADAVTYIKRLVDSENYQAYNEVNHQ